MKRYTQVLPVQHKEKRTALIKNNKPTWHTSAETGVVEKGNRGLHAPPWVQRHCAEPGRRLGYKWLREARLPGTAPVSRSATSRYEQVRSGSHAARPCRGPRPLKGTSPRSAARRTERAQ